jgi:hypothetical protein
MCGCNENINLSSGIEGPQGPQGIQGEIGNGIVSTDWTSNDGGQPQGTEGTTDTYTIVYDDGGSDTFVVYNGADGKSGDNGIDGIYGGYSSKWRYETGNTAGGITSGRLRFNNNDFTLATTLFVYDTNIDSILVTDFLNGLTNDNGYGYIRLFKEDDSTKFVTYKLTNVVDSGNYFTLTVEYIAMGSYFVYNDDVVLTFSPAGSPILSNNYLLYIGTPNTIPVEGSPGNTKITDNPGVTFSATAKEEDPLNAFNPLNGLWVCPATGYYDFTLLFAVQSGASTTGYLSVAIVRAGFDIVVCQNTVAYQSTMDSVAISASYNLRECTAGESYMVKTLNRGSGAVSNPSVHISIKRVK